MENCMEIILEKFQAFDDGGDNIILTKVEHEALGLEIRRLLFLLDPYLALPPFSPSHTPIPSGAPAPRGAASLVMWCQASKLPWDEGLEEVKDETGFSHNQITGLCSWFTSLDKGQKGTLSWEDL